ncbi:MAG: hypothetical protein J5I41_11745 [Saprospiraceae bacterium]|nr:hypothetical protein [Saprospiraceae bacterium]
MADDTSLPEVKSQEPDSPLVKEETLSVVPPADVILQASGSVGRLRSLKRLEQDFILRQQEREEVVLDDERIRMAWQEYASGVDSPSLKQFLHEAEVSLEGERIKVIVGTQMARGMIQQDSRLMPALREQLFTPGLGMRIEVDPARAPVREEDPQLPTTPREIFEHLAARNPLLHELRKRFDLTVE